MSELIDRNVLKAKMYQEAFESDTDMQNWDSGCWIRYKLFEKVVDSTPTVPYGPRWHRVEEPPKEEGKYFVAYRSSVVDGWGYDTAYYTKHLEDKMLMIPVPENSEGWFNWSDYNDCDVLVCPDYWMPIEPPKEDA